MIFEPLKSLTGVPTGVANVTAGTQENSFLTAEISNTSFFGLHC